MGIINKNQLEACKKWYWKNKEYKNQKCKEWYNEHKEERKKYNKEWREKNKEYDKQRRLDYMRTPIGRASHLVQAYKKEDKKHKRGECTLTKEWILENIFTKPCAHCGVEGWNVIGCNRINNDLPHTMDNVEPCCEECNKRLWLKEKKKPLDQIDAIIGEVLKTWECAEEAAEILGFNSSCIRQCCRGEKKKHMGYIWKYIQV